MLQRASRAVCALLAAAALSACAAATPSPSPTAAPSPTPAPTATAAPSATPAPTATAAVTEVDRQAIVDAAWAELRPLRPLIPLLVGLIDVEGDYAAALGGPQNERTIYVYLKRNAQNGGAWEVIEATSIPSGERLRQLGVPDSLTEASDAYTVIDLAMSQLQEPGGAGASGYVVVEGNAQGFARLSFLPAEGEQRDGATLFFRREGETWQFLTAGTAFSEEDLRALGVPEQLWQAGGEAIRGPSATLGEFPGPGWQELETADFSGDGIEETIYYRPSSILPRAMFSDDYLAQNAVTVSEVLIAQGAAYGPDVLLEVTPRTIRAKERQLADLAADTRGTAAFLIALDPGSTYTIALLPLADDGTEAGQIIGINWYDHKGGYDLAPAPTAPAS